MCGASVSRPTGLLADAVSRLGAPIAAMCDTSVSRPTGLLADAVSRLGVPIAAVCGTSVSRGRLGVRYLSVAVNNDPGSAGVMAESGRAQPVRWSGW